MGGTGRLAAPSNLVSTWRPLLLPPLSAKFNPTPLLCKDAQIAHTLETALRAPKCGNTSEKAVAMIRCLTGRLSGNCIGCQCVALLCVHLQCNYVACGWYMHLASFVTHPLQCCPFLSTQQRMPTVQTYSTLHKLRRTICGCSTPSAWKSHLGNGYVPISASG